MGNSHRREHQVRIVFFEHLKARLQMIGKIQVVVIEISDILTAGNPESNIVRPRLVAEILLQIHKSNTRIIKVPNEMILFILNSF